MDDITVKTTRKLKEGTGAKGSWTLCLVVGQDDEELTTFDTSVLNLKPGTVIKPDSITIKDDKKSFAKFGIVSEPTTMPGPNENGMSKEDWAQKQAIERASFEAQTAAKLVVLSDPALLDEYEKSVRLKGFQWCEAKIDANMGGAILESAPKAATTKKKQSSSDTEPSPRSDFDNVGEFLAACNEAGIPRNKVMEKLQVTEKTLPNINTTDAWQVIYEELIKPSKELME